MRGPVENTAKRAAALAEKFEAERRLKAVKAPGLSIATGEQSHSCLADSCNVTP